MLHTLGAAAQAECMRKLERRSTLESVGLFVAVTLRGSVGAGGEVEIMIIIIIILLFIITFPAYVR